HAVNRFARQLVLAAQADHVRLEAAGLQRVGLALHLELAGCVAAVPDKRHVSEFAHATEPFRRCSIARTYTSISCCAWRSFAYTIMCSRAATRCPDARTPRRVCAILSASGSTT